MGDFRLRVSLRTLSYSWETPEEANTGELEFMSGKTSGEEVELNGNRKKLFD